MSIGDTDELIPAHVAKWLQTTRHYLLADREGAMNGEGHEIGTANSLEDA